MSLAVAEVVFKKLGAENRLAESDFEALARLPSQIRNLRPHESLVRDGDHPTHSCVLLKGFLLRSKTTEYGERQILSIHIPGEAPDLQSLHLQVMDHDLVALGDCVVGLIPHEALHDITRRYPNVAAALWQQRL